MKEVSEKKTKTEGSENLQPIHVIRNGAIAASIWRRQSSDRMDDLKVAPLSASVNTSEVHKSSAHLRKISSRDRVYLIPYSLFLCIKSAGIRRGAAMKNSTSSGRGFVRKKSTILPAVPPVAKTSSTIRMRCMPGAPTGFRKVLSPRTTTGGFGG